LAPCRVKGVVLPVPERFRLRIKFVSPGYIVTQGAFTIALRPSATTEPNVVVGGGVLDD